MNWEAIGAFGEVGGFFAVIVTLVYLSLQVRSSNVQSNTLNMQTFFDQRIQSAMSLAGNREVVEILHSVAQGERLDPIQAIQYRCYIEGRVHMSEKDYYMIANSSLDIGLGPGVSLAEPEMRGLAQQSKLARQIMISQRHRRSDDFSQLVCAVCEEVEAENSQTAES